VAVNDLILAVLSELNNAGASAPSKTKLLKLLYLIDVESARSVGKPLTGWNWVFLHYGPWTADYDSVLDQLAKYDDVMLRGFGVDEHTTLVVTQRRDVDVSRIGDGTAQNVVARVLNRWGQRELGEILNFVYFETEPMQHAERNTSLDFGTVPRGRYPVYYRTKSAVDSKTLRAMRAKVNQPAAPAAAVSRACTPPRYDEVFEKALAALEED
jgi:hypothetical protein